MPYASRTLRLLGQIIDGLITSVPIVVAFILSSMSDAIGTVAILAALLFSVAYYFLADGLDGGGSLAKQWLHMAVVDAQSGAPCSYWQSFVRNLLLAVLGPIDWVFIFGERHQRLGDMLAGTIVVTTV
jgi:uncharacterized RDD family membrane protein YckC